MLRILFTCSINSDGTTGGLPKVFREVHFVYSRWSLVECSWGCCPYEILIGVDTGRQHIRKEEHTIIAILGVGKVPIAAHPPIFPTLVGLLVYLFSERLLIRCKMEINCLHSCGEWALYCYKVPILWNCDCEGNAVVCACTQAWIILLYGFYGTHDAHAFFHGWQFICKPDIGHQEIVVELPGAFFSNRDCVERSFLQLLLSEDDFF